MATTTRRFTQRHYDHMAAEIAGSENSKVEKLTVVKFLIETFQDESDKFKRDLFIRACGFTVSEFVMFVGASVGAVLDDLGPVEGGPWPAADRSPSD